MRMHRGSSKDGRRNARPSEILPLSASPDPIELEVELTRGGSVRRQVVSVPRGTLVREIVRRVGGSPEGSAVLIDSVPVPMDLPLVRPVRLVVIPTFSGG
jgi:sulfur carrier protein ThiS